MWREIQDPNLLAAILPGCTGLEPVGPDNYVADIEVAVGPIASSFKSDLAIVDRIPPDGYSFEVQGRGAVGNLSGRGPIRLTSSGESTNIDFQAEGNISGVIARIGQRLIEATGRKLMNQGFENLKQELLERRDRSVQISEGRG